MSFKSQGDRSPEEHIAWLLYQGASYWRMKSHAVPVDMLSEVGVDLDEFLRSHPDPATWNAEAYRVLVGHPYAPTRSV